MNLHYLKRQLTLAADCLKRGMDILDTEPAAGAEPHTPTREDLRAALDADGLAELHGTHRPGDPPTSPPPAFTTPATDAAVRDVFSAMARGQAGDKASEAVVAMRLARHLEERVILLAGTLKAYGERMEQLAKILLDIAPDACARHDLFGF
jgi:hypothetical protein